MLTDLHVHLRDDEFDLTPEVAFTTENVDRYLESAGAKGIGVLGVSEHMYRFRQAREVWEHPSWTPWATDDLDAYCEFVRDETPLLLGIEADYLAGREEQIAEYLAGRDWDYVIGSIHFVGDLEVNDESEANVWNGELGDVDAVWDTYFDHLMRAARSGLYDIMAHPDLVKHGGDGTPQPTRDRRHWYEPAVAAMAESGVAIELSTAGFLERVNEQYPDVEFLRLAVEAGVPVALSSDAHMAGELGQFYDRALATLAEVGIDQISTFERRTRSDLPLSYGPVPFGSS